MTTPRDVFQQSCYAALSRYKIAVAEGTWRVTADNQFVDAVLKAWDRSHIQAATDARHQRLTAADQLAGMHRAELDDELSAITVRKLRETAGR